MALAQPETRWELTTHAVERFHQRFAPDLTPDEARERLAAVFAGALITELPGDDGYGRPRDGALVYRLIYPGPPAVSFRFLAFPRPWLEQSVVITILAHLNRHRSRLAKVHGRRRRGE